MSDFVQLYAQDSEPKEAFLVNSGDIFFYLSNSDKYSMKGANFVVGGNELLLSKLLNIHTGRLETVVVSKNSSVKRFSEEKFFEGLNNYSFMLNVSMVAAKQLVITNQIIAENKKSLTPGAGSKSLKDICLEYHHILSTVIAEYEKRRLPWLKDIITKYEYSLVFKQGEIYSKLADPVRITSAGSMSDKMVSYDKGAVICEQNSEGKEMFILQNGTIEILVNGHKVATLTDAGSTVGEIALLLGEKRSATLRALNNVSLTKITQADLKVIAETNINLFKDIAKSLAQKQYNNILSIRDINTKIIEQTVGGDGGAAQKSAQEKQKASAELSSLRKAVTDLYFSKMKDAFFLKEQLGSYLDM